MVETRHWGRNCDFVTLPVVRFRACCSSTQHAFRVQAGMPATSSTQRLGTQAAMHRG